VAWTSASRGNKLYNICNSTGGTDVGCADIFSSATTGLTVPATVGGITCPAASVTVCTVKTWYDGTGNGFDCTERLQSPTVRCYSHREASGQTSPHNSQRLLQHRHRVVAQWDDRRLID
jgi:hypothetical protein